MRAQFCDACGLFTDCHQCPACLMHFCPTCFGDPCEGCEALKR